MTPEGPPANPPLPSCPYQSIVTFACIPRRLYKTVSTSFLDISHIQYGVTLEEFTRTKYGGIVKYASVVLWITLHRAKGRAKLRMIAVGGQAPFGDIV